MSWHTTNRGNAEEVADAVGEAIANSALQGDEAQQRRAKKAADATADIIRAFAPEDGRGVKVTCYGHIEGHELSDYSLSIGAAAPAPAPVEASPK